MGWRAKRKSGAASRAPETESTPGYLRAPVVIGVVAFALVLGFLMTRVGPTRAERDAERLAEQRPAVDVESETTPQSTDPDDCPAPGAAVPLDAAELIAVLQAAVADPSVGRLPAAEEVQDQIEATDPSPPLSRMTRVRGFAGQNEVWSSCVMSYWMGPDGPMQSLDVVTVEVVDGEDRSDASPSAESDGGGSGAGGSRSRSQGLADRWEVTRWLRGAPQPLARSRVAPLSFFDGSGCSRPDRAVSVTIAEGSPNERLRAALEELISGPAGRSRTASSSVPLDLQVLEATIEGSAVRIVLTPSADESITRCEGTAGYAQVVDTARAIAAESLGTGEGGEPPEIDVDVVIDGRSVDTLRP